MFSDKELISEETYPFNYTKETVLKKDENKGSQQNTHTRTCQLKSLPIKVNVYSKVKVA